MSKVFKKQTKIILPSKLSNAKLNELQNVRIMQKNLVYVIGLSAKIAKSEVNNKKIKQDFILKRVFRSIRKNNPINRKQYKGLHRNKPTFLFSIHNIRLLSRSSNRNPSNRLHNAR